MRKIYTRVVVDNATNEIEHAEFFEYDGAMALCDPVTAAVSGIGSILGGIASGIGGLFRGPPDAPQAPAITPPTVMPVPDDAAVQAAKKRKIAGLTQRQGRQSTILSDGTSSDPLGA